MLLKVGVHTLEERQEEAMVEVRPPFSGSPLHSRAVSVATLQYLLNRQVCKQVAKCYTYTPAICRIILRKSSKIQLANLIRLET